MKCNVFYSWQSDLPNSTNRGFIESALEDAAKALQQDEELVVEPVIDRDTAGVAGSPDIGITILSKIDAAIAFVCDVSIITPPDYSGRPTPNPNVLLELGYALKTLGHGRTIMVMNKAFGSPEKLPFDLKQKRVLTYELPEGADKKEARKRLASVLVEALKDILKEHQHSVAQAQARTPSPSDAAIEAVRQARPDQALVVRKYMEWFAGELAKLDPHALAGERDENLVEAIKETAPLVDDFGRVAEVIAAMNAKEAAVALLKGFEHVIKLYNLPPGFSGAYDKTDFDLFKFVGHEVCTILFAHLMRTERWQLVSEVVSEKFFRDDHRGGAPYAGVESLSSHSILLDEIRPRRLIEGGRRRLSIHADILKERHDRTPPVGDVNWDDFRAADVLLLIRTHDNTKEYSHYWWPRSAVYLESASPRFLSAATTLSGSKNLASMLGETDLAKMKERVASAVQFLRTGISQMGSWGGGLDRFDPEKIAVS